MGNYVIIMHEFANNDKIRNYNLLTLKFDA